MEAAYNVHRIEMGCGCKGILSMLVSHVYLYALKNLE